MNPIKGGTMGMCMTRRLFFAIPIPEIEPKTYAVVHRKFFSFIIHEGMYVKSKRGLVLIHQIEVESKRVLVEFFNTTQDNVVYKLKDRDLEWMDHMLIDEPFDEFIDGEKDRQKLIESQKE